MLQLLLQEDPEQTTRGQCRRRFYRIPPHTQVIKSLDKICAMLYYRNSIVNLKNKVIYFYIHLENERPGKEKTF
jgi:hypothetical protein